MVRFPPIATGPSLSLLVRVVLPRVNTLNPSAAAVGADGLTAAADAAGIMTSIAEAVALSNAVAATMPRIRVICMSEIYRPLGHEWAIILICE
ncbi:hypothetical protein Cme02nite_39180 [Catellatospora methionotrophica]|uniref:Uncharacterized protein n=1 Tax=Catellatospora methionotrophica TaxID=121620 RepID=A0A8J3PFF4_9ACTN|nr:hypothetical protein Cme02nite_39180 [Catellatospora methionotrophica]